MASKHQAKNPHLARYLSRPFYGSPDDSGVQLEFSLLDKNAGDDQWSRSDMKNTLNINLIKPQCKNNRQLDGGQGTMPARQSSYSLGSIRRQPTFFFGLSV